MWSPHKAPMQHLEGRNFWMVVSLPCWGSPVSSGYQVYSWSMRSTRMSVCSKSPLVYSFNIVELNKHSVQSLLGSFLVLGLAPQCLSFWGRVIPSQFSLFNMLTRALAPPDLPGNTVQTYPPPLKSSERPNLNLFHQGQMSIIRRNLYEILIAGCTE